MALEFSCCLGNWVKQWQDDPPLIRRLRYNNFFFVEETVFFDQVIKSFIYAEILDDDFFMQGMRDDEMFFSSHFRLIVSGAFLLRALV